MKRAKCKPLVRDISTDGQVELRGNKIILYEPLKSEIEQICRQQKITVQQLWDKLCVPALREVLKAAKMKKSKAQRSKTDTETL